MARYPKSIKVLRKGNAKKAESAREDLLTLLSDPIQEELRRLRWGPRSWQLILDGLQEAVADGPSFAGEVLSAYQAAWVATQEEWERWHEHFWQLRSQLKGWVAADGIVPVPVDLYAEKPGRELAAATKLFNKAMKEMNRGRKGEDSPERMLATLALILDHTLRFDVPRGGTFRVHDPSWVPKWTWPWEQGWPHEFEGIGQKGSGEPLLGTVVRLMNGTGTISAGQQNSEEVSSPGAMMKQYRETLLIVCDANLVVLQWHSGAKKRWELHRAFPYHQIEKRDATFRQEACIAAIEPGSRKPSWSVPSRFSKPVLDAFLDAKAHAGPH